MVDYKKCSKCGEEKRTDDFYVSKKYKCGFMSSCKSCNILSAQSWRNSNLERAKSKRMERYYNNREHEIKETMEWIKNNSERHAENKARWKKENSDKHCKSAKLHRENNPEKVSARKKTWAKISDGSLSRMPCEKCGTTTHIEAHHDDCSKPLDVRWLCKKHHTELHTGK